MEKHPLHMKTPELQKSQEVQRAVERKERTTQEKLPNDPSVRIEAYMERLENIFLNPDETIRKRNLEMFRDVIYDKLIIKPENFPESYFELQKRVARERGEAVDEIPSHVREQMIQVALEDQKASLDAWMDYLTSDDAVYPAWFKYFVWKNVTKLSQFDKERGEFKKRTDTTVAPFPDIYREPLAQIADMYEQVKEDNQHLKEPDIQEAFSKKFPSLYAEYIQKSLELSMENREQIEGIWKKYSQGNPEDAHQLFQSLEGKGTGWCTAGRSTAETQIKSGDFYVYYTHDANGEATQPRLAIRMNGNAKLGEVRGVLPHQEVEPVLQDTLDEKLTEFGTEANAYRKKSADMKYLTALERKHEQGNQLTKSDLAFLYELHSSIESFGYQRDPRIAELRKGRNVKEDMLTIFECTENEIATSVSHIHDGIKAYVGPLEKGIFEKLPEGLEHVYTSFPEGKIVRDNILVGGESAEQLIAKMESADININNYAKSMLNNKQEFIPSMYAEEIDIVRLKVRDLGFTSSPTVKEIYQRAAELGLEVCPPDTGPHYRLKYQDQPLGEWFRIATKPITGSGGRPYVFFVARKDDGLWLSHDWAKEGFTWPADDEVAFRVPSRRTRN